MNKVLIGAIAATIALAACGGGSKNNANPAAGGTNTTTKGGSGGGNALSDLVAKAKTANFKVTYKTGSSSTQTVAQDGNGKTAVITDGSVAISDGTKVINCDGTTSSATCTEIASGANPLSGMMAIYTGAYTQLAGLNSSAYGGHTSSETIAGRDAKCVTFSASDIAGGILSGKIPGAPSVTTCVDAKDGYLLKLSTKSGDNSTDEFVATAAGPASPSDFEPPSTPQTVPTIPGGVELGTTTTVP